MGGQASHDQITAQFSKDDQRQEDGQASLEHSCQQAEGVADDGQPGEEQGPDAIALVDQAGPGLAALVHAQDVLHEKEAAVESDGVGGAGTQAVADGGGGQGGEPGRAVRDQGHEQPFRAQGQDGGRQEADEKEGWQAQVEENIGQVICCGVVGSRLGHGSPC